MIKVQTMDKKVFDIYFHVGGSDDKWYYALTNSPEPPTNFTCLKLGGPFATVREAMEAGEKAGHKAAERAIRKISPNAKITKPVVVPGTKTSN
jgi:hypothetical protein